MAKKVGKFFYFSLLLLQVSNRNEYMELTEILQAYNEIFFHNTE